MNIYSLHCLSKWIKNIESYDPKLTDLDLNKIKQDLLENVLENEETKKLLYIKDYECYNYDKNQIKLNKKFWSGYHSVIHYILSNKSLLVPLLKPDIEQKQSKINKLLKLNESSLSIITKQSVSILNLLLFDTKIISLQQIFRGDYTFSYSIYGVIKSQLIQMYDKENYYKQYNIQFIMDLYLDLFIKSMECTDDDPLFLSQKRQKAIINVQYEINNPNSDYNRKYNGWQYLGLFDDHNFDCIQSEHIPRIKITINLLKKLLWRNIDPFQLVLKDNFKITKCMDIKDMVNDKTMLIKFKNAYRNIINSKFEMKMNDDIEIFECDKTITFKEKLAVTVPLVIIPFLNEIKNKMRNILNECLLGIVNNDCIDIIMQCLYCDINEFCKQMGDLSNAFNVKCYQLFHYINLLDVDELSFNNTNNQFLGVPMSWISQYILKSHAKEFHFCIIPKIPPKKQQIETQQNCWLIKSAFDYNYTKRCKRFKKGKFRKSNYNKDKKHRWRTNKINKKQSYVKRKKDKQMNSKEKEKFKKRYLMSLQY